MSINYPYTDNKSSTEYMLTTVDNPFDPFTQFDEWYAMDSRLGYNTPGLLAAISQQSNELSEIDQLVVVQQAIDEIVSENVLGVHRKVKRGDLIRIESQVDSEN
jgi:hypothetical protein